VLPGSLEFVVVAYTKHLDKPDRSVRGNFLTNQSLPDGSINIDWRPGIDVTEDLLLRGATSSTTFSTASVKTRTSIAAYSAFGSWDTPVADAYRGSRLLAGRA
jgi:hypothetical protein